MLIGSIYGWEIGKDDLFDPLSIRNRDDCLEPMRELQKYALSKGIELHTEDLVKSRELIPAFNLYVESIPIDRSAPGKNYLLLFETHLTVPLNSDPDYLNQFDGIFTWDINLLKAREAGTLNTISDHVMLSEIRVPNPIPQEFFTGDLPLGFAERPQFCCMISSNRHANQFDVRELYSERVRAIRWFEKNAPHQFYLYGNGWKVPKKRLGSLGKMIYRLEKAIPFLTRRPVFPSYQGPTVTKLAALSKTRFCICFENARDISGYFTEKMFDCLFAGCVPVYFGEPNIQNWIPSECFVDFRNFNSYGDLYQYLNNMPESEFISMQHAAREFICSDAFRPHSSQSFASNVIDRVYEKIT